MSVFPAAITHASPCLRILCIHGAGASAGVYTGSGTGARRANNPLSEFCKASNVDLLAAQLPGRELRRSEPSMQSCQDAAQHIIEALGLRAADSVPMVVVGHSCGTWIAYEVVKLLSSCAPGKVVHVHLACFPGPDIGDADRPWPVTSTLDERGLMRECVAWDTNPQVFTPGVWQTFCPLFRSDFKLFDSYALGPDGLTSFDIPCTTVTATRDKKITVDMVSGWSRVFPMAVHEIIDGNHLFVYDGASKAQWFSMIIKSCQKYM